MASLSDERLDPAIRVRRVSHSPAGKMQSMQRSFGRLMNKSPGTNAKVSVLLSEYEDADNVLAKV